MATGSKLRVMLDPNAQSTFAGNSLAQAALAAGPFVQDLDPVDLLSTVGALLLLPTNLHSFFRLEGLAHLALTGVAQGSKKSTEQRLLRLCNHTLGDLVGHLDDPWEQPATVGFTFHGGTHVVIPGGTDTIYELRLLANVLSNGPSNLDPTLHAMSTRLLQAVAQLSDSVLTQAGLRRNQRVPPQTRQVTVPRGSELQRLQTIVRFKLDEFHDLIERSGAQWDDVEPLISEIGNVDLRENPWESEHLTYQPLARAGSWIVLVAPHLLMQSVVRQIALRAVRMGAHAQLAHDYHNAGIRSVSRALQACGLHACSPVHAAGSGCRAARVSHQLWQIDRDKLMHLAVASDALEADEGTSAPAAWNTEEVPALLRSARELCERTVGGAYTPAPSLLTVVAYVGCGRNYSLLPPDEPTGQPPALVLFASELETIVHGDAEAADPLLLWKFACAYADFVESTRILAFSMLDTYGLWKRQGRRFLSVEEEPTVNSLTIVPGATAEELRWTAIERYDWHAVQHPNGSLVEIGKLERERTIYRPRQLLRTQCELVVAGQNGAVWVVSPVLKREDPYEGQIYADVVRALAYWVSEFAAALPQQFEIALARRSPVLISVDVGDISAWRTQRRDAQEPVRAGFSVSSTRDRINVEIEPAFLRRYTDSGNTAEGELATSVATELFATGGDRDAASAAVQSVLTAVVPPGPKRVLHKRYSDQRPELVSASRTKARHVQDFDTVRAETMTTQQFRTVLGSSTGKWIGDETKPPLRSAVKCHFDQLSASVRTVDAKDSVAYVMAQIDALQAQSARRQDTLASQLAFSTGNATVLEALRDELPSNAQAIVAARFLLELLAAESPVGHAPMSAALYDEWLAIAREIVSLGMACDVQHLSLAEVSIDVRPNGYRLSRGTYGEAAFNVQEASFADAIHHASATRTDFDASALPIPTAAEINLATVAEFGCSLTDVVDLLQQVSCVACEKDESVVEMPLDDLTVELATLLSWGKDRVHEVLATLTLDSRSSFVEPPPPFTQADVLPWRFNRVLSYLRRPLVRLERENGANIIFTAGAPVTAAKYLVALCVEGRIKAKSNALRRLMSRFSEVSGKLFNAQVATALRHNGFNVREQVKKLGRVRLMVDGGDLGDIDVLAADPYRKRLWAIECKNFAQARVPHEVKNDLEELFIDEGAKRSVQSRHLRRVQWLEAHLSETLGWMNIPFRGRWKVLPAFVFSQPLISPLLGHTSMPIWTLRDLEIGGGPGLASRARL